MVGAGIARAMRRLWARIEGTSAIEFAIIAPVLIVLLAGIVEASRLMWIRNSIQTATEEAARFAIVSIDATDDDIAAKAATYFDGVGSGDPDFTINHDTADGVDYVTVNGAFAFEPLFGIIPFGEINLSGKARVPLDPDTSG